MPETNTISIGPWQLIDGHVYDAESKPAPFVALDGTEHRDHRSGLVALVYGGDANASLITAAPLMLMALYEVAHHADDECGFMVNVREAIAAAEGRP